MEEDPAWHKEKWLDKEGGHELKQVAQRPLAFFQPLLSKDFGEESWADLKD